MCVIQYENCDHSLCDVVKSVPSSSVIVCMSNAEASEITAQACRQMCLDARSRQAGAPCPLPCMAVVSRLYHCPCLYS